MKKRPTNNSVKGEPVVDVPADVANAGVVAANLLAGSTSLTDEERKLLQAEAKEFLSSPEGLSRLCKQYTPKAFEKLIEHMNSPDARVSMAAIKELLNRGWGTSAIIVDKRTTVVTTDDIDARVQKALQMREKQVVELEPRKDVEVLDEIKPSTILNDNK